MTVLVNGKPRELGEGRTVADLLRELELEGRPVAVERNRAVIPRSEFPSTPLREGDRIEIVTFVGGG